MRLNASSSQHIRDGSTIRDGSSVRIAAQWLIYIYFGCVWLESNKKSRRNCLETGWSQTWLEKKTCLSGIVWSVWRTLSQSPWARRWSDSQCCFVLESVCFDVLMFEFPLLMFSKNGTFWYTSHDNHGYELNRNTTQTMAVGTSPLYSGALRPGFRGSWLKPNPSGWSWKRCCSYNPIYLCYCPISFPPKLKVYPRRPRLLKK